MVYIYLIGIHLWIVGITLAASFSVTQSMALLASIDLFGALLSSISPLFQLVFFSTMHHTLHNLHLHHFFSFSGTCFAIAHIILAHVHAKQTYSHDVWEWQMTSGALTSVGFGFSALSGILLHLPYFKTRLIIKCKISSMHAPSALLGVISLFAHRFREFGSFEDFLFLILFVTCLILFTGFFFIKPATLAKIAKEETLWDNKTSDFIIVVVNVNKSVVVAPGSYYMAYENNGNHLTYFQATLFHVLCSRGRKISFLVHKVPESVHKIASRLVFTKYPFIIILIVIPDVYY